jgi:ABC-type Mn2+/Zn2+ transport system ATPase subunit
MERAKACFVTNWAPRLPNDAVSSAPAEAARSPRKTGHPSEPPWRPMRFPRSKSAVSRSAFQHARVGWRRPDSYAWRNPRPCRRERRWQVDAHQNYWGLYQPDASEIFMSGREVHPYSESVPISFVHQDLGLLTNQASGRMWRWWRGSQVGRPHLLGEGLAVSQTVLRRQGARSAQPPRAGGLAERSGKAILGIVRAMSRDARVVVLDEPTASLPGPDALHLFEVLLRLRASGTSTLYVSHRLNELFGSVDRVTVLRDGRLARSSDIRDTTPESIYGTCLAATSNCSTRPPPAPALQCCKSRTSSPAIRAPYLSPWVGERLLASWAGAGQGTRRSAARSLALTLKPAERSGSARTSCQPA